MYNYYVADVLWTGARPCCMIFFRMLKKSLFDSKFVLASQHPIITVCT